MIKQLIRDESGVALGIAVMVMVIVGVMGAGLLVFVRNDLEAVVEVNQGQKAFDIADAGAQVAKQQILGDKVPAHYDVEGGPASCNTDANDPDDADTTDDIPRLPAGENWAPGGGGQTRSFAGGQFTVTIRWLNQNLLSDPDCIAPETTSAPEPGIDYFKVISTGRYGDAVRKIETIYETYSLNVPRAYYTPGKIDIKGSACIDSVSLFTSSTATDAITLAGGGSGCGDGTKIKGPDLAYNDWNDPPSDSFNTTPRTGPTCNRTLPDGTAVTKTCAGFGAVGGISGTKRPGLDYDKDTNPKFVKDPDAVGLPGQQADEITFPFDLESQPDANRLCDEAQAQGNYTQNPTTANSTNFSNWPASSSDQTVVCYEFTDTSNPHTLRWTVDGDGVALPAPYSGCEGPIKRGTLVIKNGGFSIKSGNDVALFRGVVITRGPEATQNSEVGDAALTGNNCLDGFINSTGPISIAGSVTPASSQESNDRPGFYGVRTWGWRELYQ